MIRKIAHNYKFIVSFFTINTFFSWKLKSQSWHGDINQDSFLVTDNGACTQLFKHEFFHHYGPASHTHILLITLFNTESSVIIINRGYILSHQYTLLIFGLHWSIWNSARFWHISLCRLVNTWYNAIFSLLFLK